jgi:arylsulfatase A-like enzyme
MEIATDMRDGWDFKINPETQDTDWEDKQWKRQYSRMKEGPQKEAWDAYYGPLNEAFKQSNLDEEDLAHWKYQRYIKDYLKCIISVDENVGRVLDHIESTGLSDNTLIVYTSDQGFYLGEHGWFDKRFIYDESFKTPLLVKWPGVIDPESVNTQMVQNLDFAQTFLEAAGVDAPKDMQGESLVPLFKGDTEGFRDAVYYHYYEYPAVHMVKRHYGIVTEEYKLVHFYYDIDEWELYDRKKDKQEMKNVYDDPEYSDVVKELTKKLADMRIKYQDSEELDNANIKRFVNRKGLSELGHE